MLVLLTPPLFSQEKVSYGLILGGFTDFAAGGIITTGAEYYFRSDSRVIPTILFGYDFTTENWDDGSIGLYQAIHTSIGLRLSSQFRGSGFFIEPMLAYQKLWLKVTDSGSDKYDTGKTFALNFLYGYRYGFNNGVFLEACAIGGYSFSPVNLSTDPFPYDYEPDHIDWHCWNIPSTFSLLNTFLIRLGITI